MRVAGEQGWCPAGLDGTQCVFSEAWRTSQMTSGVTMPGTRSIPRKLCSVSRVCVFMLEDVKRATTLQEETSES